VSRFLKNLQLAVGAGAPFHDLTDVFDLLARVEFVDNVVDEGEILLDQVRLWNLHLLAEVNELAAETVAGGTPLFSMSSERR